MTSFREMFLNHLIESYGLEYDGECSGGGSMEYNGVKITGDKTFLGFTKDDDIPTFMLSVNVRDGLGYSVSFDRYKCTVCGYTDSFGDPAGCCGEGEMEEIPSPKDVDFDFSMNPNNEDSATKSASKTS